MFYRYSFMFLSFSSSKPEDNLVVDSKHTHPEYFTGEPSDLER